MTMIPPVVAAAALALVVAAPAYGATADETPDYQFLPLPTGAGEPARPVPKYRFLFGAEARWPGSLRWRYNHANAPEPFASDRAGTIAKVRSSLETWQQSCGITFVYDGETSTPPNNRVTSPFGPQPDFENIVGWGTLEAGVAGITYAWYRSGGSGSDELVDSDIILSVDNVTSDRAMTRTAAHEWGHAVGLAHSNVPTALMAGPPDTKYNLLTAVQQDDLRGCRCLYGPATGQNFGYSCSLPSRVDLGTIGVGYPSAVKQVTFANNGNGPLSVSGVYPNSAELIRSGACVGGAELAPGEACVVSLAVQTASAGSRSLSLYFQTSDGAYELPVYFTADASVPPPAAPSTVALIEYYHAAFDHYFVTHLQDEITKLDNGTFAGWTRTGRSFKSWAAPGAGTSPVCRFFSAVFAPKSSHFYTSFSSECADVRRNADWTFEGEVFHVGLPDGAGACGAGTQPVYRIYNGSRGGAPNHRFTTDRALQQQMLGQGWQAEGVGPGVTMCAPL
jgi:hypothetical protein